VRGHVSSADNWGRILRLRLLLGRRRDRRRGEKARETVSVQTTNLIDLQGLFDSASESGCCPFAARSLRASV
jgi:hypothetical protein